MSPHYTETSIVGVGAICTSSPTDPRIHGRVPVSVGHGDYRGELGARVTVDCDGRTSYLLPIQARELAALLVLHAERMEAVAAARETR